MSIWQQSRRALGMAVTWGVLWAPLGVLTGLFMDPDGTMEEPWPALGAYPGFLCAVIFAVVLGIAERHRTLAAVPPARAGAWGALSGLILIAPLLTGLLGTPNTEHPLWQARFAILGAVIVLSAISAAASVLVARIRAGRPTALAHD